MSCSHLTDYVLFILQSFEIPLLSKSLGLKYKKLSLTVTCLWISSIMYIEIDQALVKFGYQAAIIANHFLLTLLFIYHIVAIGVHIIILILKYFSNYNFFEEKFWLKLKNLDKFYPNQIFVREQSILRVNKMFLSLVFNFLTCVLARSYFQAQNEDNYDIFLLIQIITSNIFTFFHLLKIKIILIMLNIRIESLLNAVSSRAQTENRPITFVQLKQLKFIYEELIVTCNLINETFGASLLAVIFYYFIDFIANCYWMTYVMIHTPEDFIYSYVIILLILLWSPAFVLFELALIAHQMKVNVSLFCLIDKSELNIFFLFIFRSIEFMRK